MKSRKYKFNESFSDLVIAFMMEMKYFDVVMMWTSNNSFSCMYKIMILRLLNNILTILGDCVYVTSNI